MALIKCPECGKDVSDRAEKCIHCGFPLDKSSHMSVEEKRKHNREKYYDKNGKIKTSVKISQSSYSSLNQVKCPQCGSTQIQMVPRKWSLLTGFLTNKVDRVCMNCKHRF